MPPLEGEAIAAVGGASACAGVDRMGTRAALRAIIEATRRVNAKFRDSFTFSQPFKVSPTTWPAVRDGRDPEPAPIPCPREADPVCLIRRPCQSNHYTPASSDVRTIGEDRKGSADDGAATKLENCRSM